MMLIRTRVAPSAIHGMGLFAAEAIRSGTPIWRFEAGFDREFSPEQFAALPPEAQAHVWWFAYVDGETDCRVLSGDHTCFMNHSPDPNTGASLNAVPPILTVARCDIAAGEELTCNYWAFDAQAREKLGEAANRQVTQEDPNSVAADVRRLTSSQDKRSEPPHVGCYPCLTVAAWAADT